MAERRGTGPPNLGKHALSDIRDYLDVKASRRQERPAGRNGSTGRGGIILAGILAGGAATVSGCGYSVDVTPDRTEACKDGSCLVIEPGHISYSQAQPETAVPTIVQVSKK